MAAFSYFVCLSDHDQKEKTRKTVKLLNSIASHNKQKQHK